MGDSATNGDRGEMCGQLCGRHCASRPSEKARLPSVLIPGCQGTPLLAGGFIHMLFNYLYYVFQVPAPAIRWFIVCSTVQTKQKRTPT